MKALNLNGLQYLGGKILNFFYPKDSFLGELPKVFQTAISGVISSGEVLIDSLSLFIDDMDINNTEVIFELTDYDATGYYVIDTMRVRAQDLLVENNAVVLKSGWVPYPMVLTRSDSTITIVYKDDYLIVSGNYLVGFNPYLRIYTKKL